MGSACRDNCRAQGVSYFRLRGNRESLHIFLRFVTLRVFYISKDIHIR